jgi:hypothetical protein
MVFFIEKVHILRITHFSETTKDRNLIFGMGGDANVKLCIQHFYPRGSGPTLSYKAFNLPSHSDHKYIWFSKLDKWKVTIWTNPTAHTYKYTQTEMKII